MGVRFECPNGHRLNVKAFLAGKRGICPQCDARFIVPQTSGGRAVPVEETPTATIPEPEATIPEPEATLPETKATLPSVSHDNNPPVVGEQPLPVVWYVRSTTGEQYGPANTELMNSWVAAGRVPEDSWVWRTGWESWKVASEALTELAPQATTTVDITTGKDIDAPTIEIKDPANEKSFTARYGNPQSRRERARKITIALGVLVLLLAVLLVFIL